MFFPNISTYPVSALLLLAKQSNYDPEYCDVIKKAISNKIKRLPAYELCKIIESTEQTVLKEAALDALSYKDIDQEWIELHSFKSVIDQMNIEQRWRLASPRRDTVVGCIAREYLLQMLDQYGYEVEKEEEYQRR